MFSSDEAWLKLHIAVGAGMPVCDLVRFFSGAREVLEIPEDELVKTGICTVTLAEKIAQARKTDVSQTLKVCRENGWQIITPENENYPPLLKNIKDFPLVLFCRGDLSLLRSTECISVVGTRKPNDHALMATYLFSACASILGYPVVSGGALGIDSAAHEGALIGTAGTICVLGCGFHSGYLPANELLRRRIAQNGVLITELLPFTPPSRSTFPRRNRIIAGISPATLVAQSGEKGGSMITADFAIRQSREVYCFSEDTAKSAGCDRLIAKGAKSIRVPGDLLGDIFYCVPDTEEKRKYLQYPLINRGVPLPHILKPETLSLEEFAAYNGVTPQEAYEVLNKPKKNEEKATSPQQLITEDAPDFAVHDTVKSRKKEQSEPAVREKNAKSRRSPKKLKDADSNNKKSIPERKTDLPAYLSDRAIAIYKVLDVKPKNCDELQICTGLPIQEVLSGITELELEDLVTLHPGERFSL